MTSLPDLFLHSSQIAFIATKLVMCFDNTQHCCRQRGLRVCTKLEVFSSSSITKMDLIYVVNYEA